MAASDFASAHETGAAAAGGAPTGSKVVVQETTRRVRKRRAAADGGGDEEAKAAGAKSEYQCRFCNMKFEKSQALGGHMNRHRQEREKEQFQHAQEIVSLVAQQQMPRTWSSLSVDTTQSPSGPSGNSGALSSRLSSHLSGSATHQQYAPPPISFGTHLSSSSSIPSNSNHQLQQWLGSMDGFSNAASNSPRATAHSGSSSFYHHPHPVENNMASSLQAAGVPTEFLANMFRGCGTPNDGGNIVHISPGTSTSSQVPGMYDIIHNSHLSNAFYNGGL